MQPAIIKIAAAALLMLSDNAPAADMPPLAKKYNCTNCHAIDVEMIGPSWMNISKAYNGKRKSGIRRPVAEILRSKTPEEWLMQKVSHGGAGVWGTVLMPALDPKETRQKEMRTLTVQILELSKGSTSKEEMLKSADRHRCTACHGMDKAGIGPSWMAVSNIYNNNGATPYGVKIADVLSSKTPEEWLMLKISHGGQGNWNGMLMPAMEYVAKPGGSEIPPDETQRYNDMQELVTFIMSLAKE